VAAHELDISTVDLPNDNVDQYNSSDNRAFDPISEAERQDHHDGKDESQAVGDLSQKNLEYRDLLAIFQAVGAIRGQASGRFIASETIPALMLVYMMVSLDGRQALT